VPTDIVDRIAVSLTDLMVDCLKKNRDLTVVLIEVVKPEHWFLAALPISARQYPTFYLDVKVTEGTNTKDQKARFISATFTALEGLLGTIEAASYIVIDELRADAWGYQGQTQEYRYVSAAAV
jgi:4-oxalocrotonate tautomerase